MKKLAYVIIPACLLLILLLISGVNMSPELMDLSGLLIFLLVMVGVFAAAIGIQKLIEHLGRKHNLNLGDFFGGDPPEE